MCVRFNHQFKPQRSEALLQLSTFQLLCACICMCEGLYEKETFLEKERTRLDERCVNEGLCVDVTSV